MNAGLKPYPVMKPSGLPWLGMVPEHWEITRAKNVFRCIDVRSSTGEEELLTVSSERGVVPRSSATVTMFKAESYVGYKLCWPGDLVVNSLWAWGRGLGVSWHHGIVSSAYGVYRLRPKYRGYAEYVHRLVRSTPFNWELQVRSKGIWISRLQLTDEAFLGAPIPLPPVPEQAAIVRFLDYMDRRIQRHIRAKQKLIKLLEEQKQAIIHRAVTRGLDPNVRLKPSGVKLLGKVPEHWEVRKLGTLGTFHKGRGIARADITNSGVPAITYGDIYTQYAIQAKTLNKFTTAQVAARAFEIHSGDLLFAASGETVDEIGKTIVYVGTPPAYAGGDIIVLRLDQADGLYLSYVLNSKIGCGQKSAFGRGDIIVHISATKLKRIVAPLPPLDEQRRIAEFLDGAIAAISAASDSACHEINLLYEYRTRLIADVVTGKLDVREAAASLPDEQDESEPHDEPETDSDAEELSDNDTAEVAEEVEA